MRSDSSQCCVGCAQALLHSTLKHRIPIKRNITVSLKEFFSSQSCVLHVLVQLYCSSRGCTVVLFFTCLYCRIVLHVLVQLYASRQLIKDMSGIYRRMLQ